MGVNRATVIRSAAAVVIIAVAATAGLLVTFRIANTQKQDYFRQRNVQATTAAASIDYRAVQQLEGTSSDLGTATYDTLRSQLVRIQRSDPHIRFVYLMRPVGGKMVFLVDAEDPSSPDYSPQGQVYTEAKHADFVVFQGKQKPETWMEGPLKDRWGTWMSASSYITDQTGKPIAMLGTDADVATALDTFNSIRRFGVIFDVLAVLLMTLVALQYIIWQHNRDRQVALRTEMRESTAHLNEELLKADRMKSDFLQLASHELRSPVNAVNVAVQTLDLSVGDKLSEDEQTLVDVARNGSDRLADLVDNLLDMTRIEAGDLVIKPAEVDVSELVAKSVQLFEPVARKKRIGLTAVLPDGPVEAVLDPQSALRVIENLITNAVKFTDFGGVVVELKPTTDKVRI